MKKAMFPLVIFAALVIQASGRWCTPQCVSSDSYRGGSSCNMHCDHGLVCSRDCGVYGDPDDHAMPSEVAPMKEITKTGVESDAFAKVKNFGGVGDASADTDGFSNANTFGNQAVSADSFSNSNAAAETKDKSAALGASRTSTFGYAENDRSTAATAAETETISAAASLRGGAADAFGDSLASSTADVANGRPTTTAQSDSVASSSANNGGASGTYTRGASVGFAEDKEGGSALTATETFGQTITAAPRGGKAEADAASDASGEAGKNKEGRFAKIQGGASADASSKDGGLAKSESGASGLSASFSIADHFP